MRITIVLMLFLVRAPAQAQTDAWANKLFEGKTNHKFGVVPWGADLHHRFPVKNIYAVPLEITQVRVSCGCVTAKAVDRMLAPGATTFIDATMDGRRFRGDKSVTIYVTVGPKFISTAQLTVSATSRTDIVFNPGHANFGIVSPGDSVTQVVDVEYAGRLDWRIQDVVTEGTPFKATVTETYRSTGVQVGYRINLSMAQDVAPGMIKKPVLLKTNDPNSPLIPLLVEANVQALISVTPPKVDLGTLAKGMSVTKRVLVQGKKPFRITKVDGTGEGIKVDSVRPSSDGTLHVVTFAISPEKVGEVRRELLIRTDLQQAPLKTELTGVVSQ